MAGSYRARPNAAMRGDSFSGDRLTNAATMRGPWRRKLRQLDDGPKLVSLATAPNTWSPMRTYLPGAVVDPVVELSAVGACACGTGEPDIEGTAAGEAFPGPVVAICPCGVAALGSPAPLPDVVASPNAVALELGARCAKAGAVTAKNATAARIADFTINSLRRKSMLRR